MGRRVLSEVAYLRVAETAERAGSATHAGEQRRRQGLGLHPLVDPSGYEVIRRSLSWYEPRDGYFELLRGVAMLEETRLDTTGSMGTNVEVAMRVLPSTYKLLSTGSKPVLGRYDLQMITSIFGDVCDQYILCRSQAEMDERIAEQMTLMVPEGGGGDETEDPQYGIFGGAYLTKVSVNDYGLKYYDFTVSDATTRTRIDPRELIRVFGKSVFEKLTENGYPMSERQLPDLRVIVSDLLKNAHAFFLQVGNNSQTYSCWRGCYGVDRVVQIPETELLPYVKAAIIGLTEGVLDLQSLEEYLRGANVDRVCARDIKNAVAHIPIGAQTMLPNFDKIPLKGAKFAKKGDLWPIGYANDVEIKIADSATDEEDEDKEMWL